VLPRPRVHRVAAIHARLTPAADQTPRAEHNGKFERYQRTLAEELLYAREWSSETGRTRAITVWNIHYNYHRPHTAIGDQPPASRLKTRVTNVPPSNT
jgi:transposase InsO family protein